MGELEIRTSAGEDAISLTSIDASDTIIRTGSGSDRLDLFGNTQFGYLEVALGSGNDNFYSDEFVTFEFDGLIHGGSGEDSAVILAGELEFFPTFESFENMDFDPEI